MHAVETCGQPYDHNGDWRPCPLAHNHDGSCQDANHATHLETLRLRTWEAQRKDPWL